MKPARRLFRPMPPIPRASVGVRIVEAGTAAQLAAARALIEEYARSLDVDLCFQGYADEIAQFPWEYAPPTGVVLVAYDRRRPVGVVALRQQASAVCEMKRLYVRPEYQGRGIGRALSERLLAKARALGYHRMRLDTLPSMTEALGLYRSLGFHEIPAYRPNPVDGAKYLEVDLGDVPVSASHSSFLAVRPGPP